MDTASPPRTWTGRSLGSRWQHGFFYGLIRHLGRRPAYVLADGVAWFFVLTRASVRAGCEPYLRRRFPERRGMRRLLDAWRMCRELGRILVDRAALGILGAGALEARHTGGPRLLELLSEGRGLILLTAHVGAWQVGMVGLPNLEVPVTVVMHRAPGDVDRQYFEHQPGQAPFRVLDPAEGGSLALLSALEQGQVLCFMGDRVMAGTGGALPARLLGDPIAVPFGPLRLAAATGAPIAVVFYRKPDLDTLELEVAEVIRVPDLGRRPDAYGAHAQAFADALEAFTRREPYRFFNFYDLWAPPAG